MKIATSVLLASGIIVCGILVSFFHPFPVAHAQTACDATAFTGAYGYTQSGYAYDAQGNIYFLAAAGRMVADGAGAITGTETLNFDGSVIKRQYTGTYTMNEDCTGSTTLTMAAANQGSPVHGDIVAVNNSRQVNFVQTDANFVFSGVLTKQNQ
jgi:hypothetical protein